MLQGGVHTCLGSKPIPSFSKQAVLPPPRPKIGGHLTILKEAASLWSGLRRRITCAICAMFSDFDADPLLIHPSLNHGMGIVAAAQILKEKSVSLDPSQTCEKNYFVYVWYYIHI